MGKILLLTMLLGMMNPNAEIHVDGNEITITQPNGVEINILVTEIGKAVKSP